MMDSRPEIHTKNGWLMWDFLVLPGAIFLKRWPIVYKFATLQTTCKNDMSTFAASVLSPTRKRFKTLALGLLTPSSRHLCVVERAKVKPRRWSLSCPCNLINWVMSAAWSHHLALRVEWRKWSILRTLNEKGCNTKKLLSKSENWIPVNLWSCFCAPVLTHSTNQEGPPRIYCWRHWRCFQKIDAIFKLLLSPQNRCLVVLKWIALCISFCWWAYRPWTACLVQVEQVFCATQLGKESIHFCTGVRPWNHVRQAPRLERRHTPL